MSSAHTGPSHLRALRTRTTNTQHFESGALGLPSLVHIEQLEARQKSKRRHGLLLTDREIALSWAAQEARSFIALQNDRVFAQAIYETENGTRTRLPTTGVDKRFQDQLRARFIYQPFFVIIKADVPISASTRCPKISAPNCHRLGSSGVL